MTHFDVIIIGTGAGGGTLAQHLAPTGKRILILERGTLKKTVYDLELLVHQNIWYRALQLQIKSTTWLE